MEGGLGGKINRNARFRLVICLKTTGLTKIDASGTDGPRERNSLLYADK